MKLLLKRPPSPRGFVLIVVTVCGVAMLVIAMAIVFTGGAGQLNALKDQSTDRSALIAEAGLERATAYARQVAEVEDDFDLLLDPGLSTNCSALTGHAVGRPRYSDQSSVVTFPAGSGVTWSVVQFNGGAYLTRFDDDSDDVTLTSRLTPFTSNRPQNNCEEGPTGAGGGNNLARDRNRAIWISVLGIYPGTDPARAKHRTAVRRFYIANQETPQALIAVGGNFDTGHLLFCSDLGDIRIAGNADLSNQTDTCGTLSAGGNVTNSSGAANCSSHGITCTHGGDTGQTPFSIDVPDARDRRWYDYTSFCNIYADSGDKSLYFWDGDNGACAAFNGSLPDPSTAFPGSCWIPIIYNGATIIAGEVVPAGLGRFDWRPLPGSLSIGPLAPLVGGPLNTVAPAFTKPDWSQCPKGLSNFTWEPPSGGVDPRCAPCGTSPVARVDTGASEISYPWTTETGVPPVVIFHRGNFNDNIGGAGEPGAGHTRADWPMATLIIEGNADLNGPGRIGVGTGKVVPAQPPVPELPAYPSLVVGGNLDVSNKWGFGGSVWVRGNADFANGSNVEVYGLLQVRGNLDIGNGGKLDVVVKNPLVSTSGSISLAAPTSSRTIR